MSTIQEQTPKPKKYRKDKPWDNQDIDHWKIDAINPEQIVGSFLEQSSFSVLFPQYRQKYIQQCHGIVKKRLMEHGVKFQLNLLEGSMTVRTTKKTWDPYIIIKARDVIKLISRSVPYQQSLKVLQDGICCQVIKIRSFVRNKQRFVKRRQRLIGPNGDTLKALQLLTQCYILVQGSTVSIIGNFKNIKLIRRIIIDTMQNIHPIYHIKQLMVKRELMKDETLKDQNWDKYLPKFKQIKMSKNKRTQNQEQPQRKEKKTRKQKKQYNPFPPEPTPRIEDIKMETGEYFLSEKEVKQRKIDIKKKKQQKVRREKQLDRQERDEEENDEQKQLQEEKRRQATKNTKKAKGGEMNINQLKQKFLQKPIKKLTF